MHDGENKTLHDTALPNWVWLFWLLQNILSRIGGWVISSIRPIVVREHLILSWPPQSPFWLWFERIWFAPLERWDTASYIMIASSGYSAENGSAQFHPLYPLLAAPLTRLGLPSLLSLVIVSTTASLASLCLIYKLALIDLRKNLAVTSVLLLFCSPFAFALFIPYSESLFILCAILTLYYSRMERWWLAGISAALATLTRQQGIILLLPLIWEYCESRNFSLHDIAAGFGFREHRVPRSLSKMALLQSIPTGFSLLMAPGAYVLWIGFRALYINDVSVDFSSFNNLIYSLLISPYAVRIVPVQKFIFPWHAFWLAGKKLFMEPDADIITNAIWGIYFLVLLAMSWKSLRKSYRIYCLATTLVSFSYYTGTLHPYMGLIRHLLLGFPIFIGLAAQVKSSLARLVLTVIGLVGFFHLSLFYSLQVWVP